MKNLQALNEDILLIREKSPLILNITNFVSMDIVANSLIAIGASPVISVCKEEAVEAVGNCDALTVNLGTLDKMIATCSKIAAASALSFSKPWILDPAGAGFTSLRTKVATDLALNYRPSAIRANPSEIISIATTLGFESDTESSSKGVDSLISSEYAIEAAKFIAKKVNCTVAVSGETDYVTNGRKIEPISYGDAFMSKVTATGCTATAICSAFCAIDPNTFNAMVNGITLYKLCGKQAASKCNGSGSFRTALIDELYNFKTV